jgi:hypothetical protein
MSLPIKNAKVLAVEFVTAPAMSSFLTTLGKGAEAI